MRDTEFQPSIVRVWVKNFRSIEHAELELGSLTVLVGPNASGKSNLLDVLRLLSDAARDGLEAAINRRGGIDSVGRRSPNGRILGPEIGFEYKSQEGTLLYFFALNRRRDGEYRVRQEIARLEPLESDGVPPELKISNGRIIKPSLRRALRKLKEDGDSNNLADIVNQLVKESSGQDLQLLTPEPSRLSMFLAVLLNQTGAMQFNLGFHLHINLESARDYLGKVGLYHVFPNILRHPQKAAESHPLAAGGENLASILQDMTHKKSRFLPDMKAALTFAVPGVRDIRVKPAGSYYVVELRHERDGGTEKGSWFDLSHESDGTIRLLAMLTALFQDPAPSLICLEEPELAIHPGAMAVLSDTMTEAALRGQVLVATHSPDLIDRLPIDSIRAVTAEDGSTRVGKVADYQLKSVREDLFSPGELHSMEGLEPAVIGE